MSEIGHNSKTNFAVGQLKSLVERVERLEEDKKAVSGDIKEVYAEAKANGFDTKILRKVIAARKKDAKDREEEQAVIQLYYDALGMAWMPGRRRLAAVQQPHVPHPRRLQGQAHLLPWPQGRTGDHPEMNIMSTDGPCCKHGFVIYAPCDKCEAEQPRIGDWMQSFSGKRFWPMDPHADDINLIDIAHALSNICRFGGHCEGFYSVAEHCVHASYLVDDMVAAEALLHDASEAYLADVPRPLKKMLPDYRPAEQRWEWALAEKFHLIYPMPKQVNIADNQMLRLEARAIMKDPPAEWYMEPMPEPTRVVQIECWSPLVAEHRFLTRAAELGIH